MSTRRGGVSQAPFESLNLRPAELGGEAMDAAAAVAENQRRFAAALGARPVWLNQVHGAAVLRLCAEQRRSDAPAQPPTPLPCADASITVEPGVACTVLVADCLPVLFCTRDGRGVGAAHAGWRGLAAGVLDNTVQALCDATGAAPHGLLAWLGPCIGPEAFEVGPDVLQAFGVRPEARDAPRFRFTPRADGTARWHADLAGLARDRLARIGLASVHGGHWCTVRDDSRFFSFRRDGRTGRLAAAVALADV